MSPSPHLSYGKRSSASGVSRSMRGFVRDESVQQNETAAVHFTIHRPFGYGMHGTFGNTWSWVGSELKVV